MFFIKLFLSVLLSIMLALIIDGIMCILSIHEMSQHKNMHWNGEHWIIDDYEMESLAYLEKIDSWYPISGLINNIEAKYSKIQKT